MKYFLPVLLTFSFIKIYAQKNDYIWLSGYDSNVIVDSATNGFIYGISVLNFNFTPVTVSHDSFAMNFDRTNTSYCNNDGNLLFYTNGIYIANSINQPIANSSGMNQGWLDEVFDPTIQTYGYRNAQGIFALPDLVNNNRYYLVYSNIDTGADVGLTVPRILTASLDMSANNGMGSTVYKNEPILQGDLSEEITAVKHGNGRDWWILVQKRNSNCYYSVLLSDIGFTVMPDLSCGGQSIPDTDIASVAFSPDGNKFANYDPEQGLNIYDFDRCTGKLSDPVYCPLDIWSDTLGSGNGVAFSPNSRFLYVSATKYLLQFDMWAADVAASVDTVGRYDGFRHPFGSYFNTEQLGPDGKIYISCGNGEADYHVINNPDAKGDSCNLQQHGILLPSPSIGVPNFPNYRLGKLAGSPCDTITGLNEIDRDAKEQILKVFPNPANDAATIDYGFTDWNKGPVSLQITNTLGQTIYTQPLPMYSGFQKINTTSFAAGTYMVFIKRNNGVVAAEKLVVVH